MQAVVADNTDLVRFGGLTRYRALQVALGTLVLGYALAVLIASWFTAELGFQTTHGGNLVLSVTPKSVFARAGLRAGDTILQINGKMPDGPVDRAFSLRSLRPHERLELLVSRGNLVVAVEGTLERTIPLASTAGFLLGIFLIGLGLFTDRGRDKGHPQTFFRATLVYAVFLAGCFSYEVIAYRALLYLPWMLAVHFVGPVTCHSMLQFPLGPERLSRRALIALYLPPSLLSAFVGMNHLLFLAGQPLRWHETVHMLAAVLVGSLAALYLAIGALARFKRLRDNPEFDRQTARWLRIGSASMAAPLVVGWAYAIYNPAAFVNSVYKPLIAISICGGVLSAVMAIAKVPIGSMTFFIQRLTGTERGILRRSLRQAAEEIATIQHSAEFERQLVHRLRQALRARTVCLYMESTDHRVWRRASQSGNDVFPDTLEGGALHTDIQLTLRRRKSRVGEKGRVIVPIGVYDGPPAALVILSDAALHGDTFEMLDMLSIQFALGMTQARTREKLAAISQRLKRETHLAEKRRLEIVLLEERLGEFPTMESTPLIATEGMKAILDRIEDLAQSDCAILFRGETGVGKKTLAREIHNKSARSDNAFVVVAGNDSAFDVDATFEQARGGTLFMDGVTEAVLERVLSRAGDENVRILAGTTGELSEEVSNRLVLCEVEIAPLRERMEDVPVLARGILSRALARAGHEPRPLSQDAVNALLRHHWPENVRELEEVLEAASQVSEGDEVYATDLPIFDSVFPRSWRQSQPRALGSEGGSAMRPGFRQALERLERDRLEDALSRNDGNKTKTADALGLSRGALLRRLKRYGLMS
jgi:transcriptional regulator with GAF, ATPase, and Fis domain